MAVESQEIKRQLKEIFDKKWNSFDTPIFADADRLERHKFIEIYLHIERTAYQFLDDVFRSSFSDTKKIIPKSILSQLELIRNLDNTTLEKEFFKSLSVLIDIRNKVIHLGMKIDDIPKKDIQELKSKISKIEANFSPGGTSSIHRMALRLFIEFRYRYALYSLIKHAEKAREDSLRLSEVFSGF